MTKATRRTRITKGRPKTAPDISTTPEDLALQRGQAASIEDENQRLRNRVAELEREHQRLQGKICDAVGQGIGGDTLLARKFVATELQHGDLASLYVASTRLQTTLNRQEVLTAIREIAINLIGVEELAVFENNPQSSTLSLIDCYGNASAIRPNIPLGEGPIGAVALTGDFRFSDVNGAGGESGHADMPMVCAPLKVDGKVWGVIVIFRLLPQKERLARLDYQLLDLLSCQAGVALYCARLNAERVAARKITS